MNTTKNIKAKKNRFDKSFKQLVSNPRFKRIYLIATLTIVAITTVYWSTLGALINSYNADQIVNTKLFESIHTFTNATLPVSHSFLLKWPIFWLAQLMGGNKLILIIFTVLISVVTVVGLLLALSKIEKRPLVLGTYALALSSILLMIPAQSYPGAFLPLNMAMLATRNIEYLVFVAGLFILAKSVGYRDYKFWGSVSVFALLFASDRIFAVFSLGGALLATLTYAYSKQWKSVTKTLDWLLSSAAGYIIAMLLIGLISLVGIVNFTSGGSPYSFVHSAKDLVLGGFFVITGIVSNFGANPASATVVAADYPRDLIHNLLGLGLWPFIVNAWLFCVGMYCTFKVFVRSFSSKKSVQSMSTSAGLISVFLIWASIIAVVSFVLSDHYYAVDGRYLTVIFFTVVISSAAYLRNKKIKATKVVTLGALLFISILFGLVHDSSTYLNEKRAISDISTRTSTINQILSNHKSSVLLGDYWRVLPVKLANNSQKIIPLSNCTVARQDLSSSEWNHDLTKSSFAYLLSLEGGNNTDFPNCTLEDVTAYYGRPNSSVLVSGSLKHPKEFLLFYDHGKRSQPKSRSAQAPPITLLPTALDEMPASPCLGPTSLNIVAHEDDDLLFMNPDISHEIQAGHCVRTIYLTAGDSGNGKYYYLGRQQGSQAAYSSMLGANDTIWVDKVIELPNHEYITISNPKGNNKISLIFMNLPDGNLKGDGFKSSDYESLAKLLKHNIHLVTSLDGQSSYNPEQITDTLTLLMHYYQPAELRLMAPRNMGYQYPDHSDHISSGKLAQSAYDRYETEQYANRVSIPITYYIGYPTHEREANVFAPDLEVKQAAFFAYAKFDNGVCSTLEQCNNTETYGIYLSRQYTTDN